MTITINKKTGKVVMTGINPCMFCKEYGKCDMSQLKPCFIPCG